MTFNAMLGIVLATTFALVSLLLDLLLYVESRERKRFLLGMCMTVIACLSIEIILLQR